MGSREAGLSLLQRSWRGITVGWIGNYGTSENLVGLWDGMDRLQTYYAQDSQHCQANNLFITFLAFMNLRKGDTALRTLPKFSRHGVELLDYI